MSRRHHPYLALGAKFIAAGYALRLLLAFIVADRVADFTPTGAQGVKFWVAAAGSVESLTNLTMIFGFVLMGIAFWERRHQVEEVRTAPVRDEGGGETAEPADFERWLEGDASRRYLDRKTQIAQFFAERRRSSAR